MSIRYHVSSEEAEEHARLNANLSTHASLTWGIGSSMPGGFGAIIGDLIKCLRGFEAILGMARHLSSWAQGTLFGVRDCA